MKTLFFFLAFVCFIGAGSACASKIEHDYDKFSEISSSKLKNINIRTKERVLLNFELTKAKYKDNEPDFFLSVQESNSAYMGLLAPDFYAGGNLWLVIDKGEVIKLRGSELSTEGKHLVLRSGSKVSFAFDNELIAKIKKARSIEFELSACAYLKSKKKSVNGIISGKDLNQFKKFFVM